MNVNSLTKNMLIEGTGEEGLNKETIKQGFTYNTTNKTEILEMIFIKEGSWVLEKRVNVGKLYKLLVGRSFH